MTLPVIRHESVKMVTVKEGFAGVSFDEGALVVLRPGRHVLDRALHDFAGFVTLGLCPRVWPSVRRRRETGARAIIRTSPRRARRRNRPPNLCRDEKGGKGRSACRRA